MLKKVRSLSVVVRVLLVLALVLTGVIVYSIAHDAAVRNTYNRRADQDCTALQAEMLKDVKSLQGFTVSAYEKSCVASKDEIGGTTGYSNYVHAKISIDNPEDAANVQAKLIALRDGLPAKGYKVNVQNIRASNENPPALCLEVFRYLDKKAQSNPLDGAPQRNSQFIEQGVEYNDWRCQGL